MSISLGSLINMLEKAEQDKFVSFSLEKLHSFRGEPEELAIELGNGCKVSEMLDELTLAVGKSFEGYKGGDYRMSRKTPVHFAYHGDCEEHPEWFASFADELFS